MASTMEGTITLTVHCLCEANVFKTEVAKSKLPLQAHMCHCDSCRHVSGALYSSETRWPEPRSNVDISKLKVYHFSSQISLLFCPTCSTPIFWLTRNDQSRLLGVWTGALANVNHDIVKFTDHIFVGDTLDGGATEWLRHPNADGAEIKRYKGSDTEKPEDLPEQWPSTAELTGYEAKKESAVPIRCKCKGVDLLLNRGDYSDFKEEDLPFNIDPKTHKLLATLCGCDSCRLQCGVDVFNWTFAEMKNISFGNQNGGRFPGHQNDLKKLVDARDLAIGSLTYHASSPGVLRFFCSTCSACIFYSTDRRPTIIDIAVGVLEASDGALAEGLLSWTYGARIDYREDGDGGWRKELFDRVEKDGEAYRTARSYPKNWKRVDDEKEGKIGKK
ncbi:hypothetical protein N0V83_010029 [Neocucurbitaria cava]|uniref:CENP-V/GFA domain-containing protein n=1 Tax=Neocucurbitaria cava TaxID=798079 RepID=A0A9W8XZZ1_9PLEO|nr:hypothetical protein N0V83_010029 [Neocucurbitaria cava]